MRIIRVINKIIGVSTNRGNRVRKILASRQHRKPDQQHFDIGVEVNRISERSNCLFRARKALNYMQKIRMRQYLNSHTFI